jgi:hypothetical protein
MGKKALIAIVRNQERERRNPSDGVSWWRIKLLNQHFPNPESQIPGPEVLRHLYQGCSNAGLVLDVMPPCDNGDVLVGMQVGQRKAVRDKFKARIVEAILTAG